MKKILERVSDSFEIITPAMPYAIETAENLLKITFPTDYQEFLRFSNGLEGETPDGYLVLWSVEELVELNRAYNVTEFASNILLIGSDGAEDAFAFHITNMSIVKLPFIGMGYVTHEKLSDTFSEFLSSRIKEKKGLFKRLFR